MIFDAKNFNKSCIYIRVLYSQLTGINVEINCMKTKLKVTCPLGISCTKVYFRMMWRPLLIFCGLIDLCVSQLGEGTIPWGCGAFKYHNATFDAAVVPGIIEQALFEVDNYIEYLYAIEGVPSISFGIVYGNELIHYYSVGSLNLKTNDSPTKDSIYRIGSISKVWTTLMAFIMRDNGTISFDSPISDYNSNFSINNPWGIDKNEQTGQKITVKHLASQVSGLPREAPCLNATSDNTCYLEDTNIILKRLRDEFSLIHPTDIQGSYSNLGFALLGNILSEYIGSDY